MSPLARLACGRIKFGLYHSAMTDHEILMSFIGFKQLITENLLCIGLEPPYWPNIVITMITALPCMIMPSILKTNDVEDLVCLFRSTPKDINQKAIK